MATRDLVLKEILTTEQSFVKTLTLLCQDFIPILTQYLSAQDISILFNNVQSLYSINQSFLKDLEIAFKTREEKLKANPKVIDDDSIALVMVKFAPFFKPYGAYSGNYDFANDYNSTLMSTAQWNKQIKPELDKKVPGFKSIGSLAFYLIQPVQRPVRYGLLLRELLKNTDPKLYPKEHQTFTVAARLFDDLASVINQEIKTAQSRFLVQVKAKELGIDPTLMVMPYRYFIEQFELSKILPRREIKGNNKNIEQQQVYDFFLFNDMLIYALSTKSKSSTSSSPTTSLSQTTAGSYEVVQVIPFDILNDGNGLAIVDDLSNPKNTSFYITKHCSTLLGNNNNNSTDNDKKNNKTKENEKTYNNIMSIYLNSPNTEHKMKYFTLLQTTLTDYRNQQQQQQQQQQQKKNSTQNNNNNNTPNITNTNNYEIMLKTFSLPSNEAISCANCNSKFGILTHRHSCKGCNEMICDACGQNYETIKTLDKTSNKEIITKIRLCDICCVTKPDKNLSLFNTYWGFTLKDFLISSFRYLVGIVNVFKLTEVGEYKPYTLLICNDLIFVTTPILSSNVKTQLNTNNTTIENTKCHDATYNNNAQIYQTPSFYNNDNTIKYDIHYILPINEKLVINNTSHNNSKSGIVLEDSCSEWKKYLIYTDKEKLHAHQTNLYRYNLINGLFKESNMFTLEYHLSISSTEEKKYGKHQFYFDSIITPPQASNAPTLLQTSSSSSSSSSSPNSPSVNKKDDTKKDDKKKDDKKKDDKKKDDKKKDDNNNNNKNKLPTFSPEDEKKFKLLKEVRKKDRLIFLNRLAALIALTKTRPPQNIHQFCKSPNVPAGACIECNTTYGWFSAGRTCGFCYTSKCKSCIKSTAIMPQTNLYFNICEQCTKFQPTGTQPKASGWFWW